MKKIFALSFAAALLAVLIPENPAALDLGVSSTAFRNGGRLPARHTCDGPDLSPPIYWTYQGKAASFALACTDPDAPGGTFIHWVIYNIPPDARSLREGFPLAGGNAGVHQGANDFGKTGYNGPCPPRGKPHRYVFTLYALDIPLGERGLDYAAFMEKTKGHIIAEGRTIALYGR
jgi:Raf kinase inhibitor-like YbhB/YbcL family protein